MIKKIDLEAHFYDISSVEALKAQDENSYPHMTAEDNTIHWVKGIGMCQNKFGAELLDYADKRIKSMDALGIEKSILSLAPGIDFLPPESSRDACRKANDALYKIIQEFPGRFLGSAIVPILDPDAAVKELERCVKELGFVMWQTHSNYGDRKDPDNMEFRPVWKKCEELGIFAYLHPTVSYMQKFNDYGYPMAAPALGFTADTMAAIIRMILSGMFDEMPNLKVVLGHFGEALPFLMERMDNRFTWLKCPEQKNEKKVSEYFGTNIFVTTSGNASIPAFECTRSVLGIDSIMLGTDYPFERMEDCIAFLESCPMTEEEKEKLYYKNAEKLGLFL